MPLTEPLLSDFDHYNAGAFLWGGGGGVAWRIIEEGVTPQTSD